MCILHLNISFPTSNFNSTNSNTTNILINNSCNILK